MPTAIASAVRRNQGKGKAAPVAAAPLTYADYIASPEESARYDILDGHKIYRTYGEKVLSNPTRDHQAVQGEIYVALRAYARRTGACQAIMAPCDVLIRRSPLRTRQPDIFLISAERLAKNPPPFDPAPMSPAPEFAVKILSPSDTRRVQADKLKDYAAVDVRECWLVSMEAATIEILSNNGRSWVTVGIYGIGQVAASVAFPGLTIATNDVFPF